MSNADVVPMFDKHFKKLLLKKPLRIMDCDSGTDGDHCAPSARRTDPSVQVDYAGVVDLDIGASKSDICAVRVVTISELARGVFGGRTTIFRIVRS
jgi:hypothetical protein